MAGWNAAITGTGYRGPALVVVLYLVLAAAFAVVVPPFEAPDETGHLFYVNHVATTLHLPNQHDPTRHVEGEGHQFPLAYLGPALVTRLALADASIDLQPQPNRDPQRTDLPTPRPKFVHNGTSIFSERSDAVAFYLLRAWSIGLGALTLLAAWLVARELLPGTKAPLLAMALIATLPQFLFNSAVISNDSQATLLCTVTILATLRSLRDPRLAHIVFLGASLGLSLATKKTALFLVPMVAVALALLLLRAPHPRGRFALRLTLAPLLALLLVGPILLRNQHLYGDPLGTAMERATMPALLDEKSLWSGYWPSTFLPQLGASFVGVFGWMDVRLPGLLYLGFLLLGVAAALGLALLVARRKLWPAHYLALGFVAACFAGIVYYNLTYTQYQGRFLFPVIAPFAALCVLGWSRLLQRSGLSRWRARLGVSLVALFTCVTLYALQMLHEFYTAAENYL